MLRFLPIPTEIARAYQAGGVDSYGLLPERKISDGGGNPCRHCLRMIPEGKGMLVLAHRPFGTLQPYAETGPIFLCADPCDAGGGPELPEILSSSEYIVRGYGADERILYGTGGVVETGRIPARATELLAMPEVAFVHVRSARNNCFQLRIERD
ncbi:DUF1203 domain-containing protein [Fuscovulum ytuae]|uniref:DUF1203 domain-containing protein n=1 Tax=Fuscovulum ytuae TaxID=3042299 RepID=A0ABY8Q653_9RHOB|nr:DUF1203 domain-containing protein [Fuscovulum sp. YMD61]WGV15750.1 DUF1203 domain-containing protein [Fuscovulum sp. YMD61]